MFDSLFGPFLPLDFLSTIYYSIGYLFYPLIWFDLIYDFYDLIYDFYCYRLLKFTSYNYLSWDTYGKGL